MIHGNPFNLKALVDKWPDFNTVVVRPQEQEMTDDLDFYINTYQVYSKDPQNCQEFLESSEVINWKQHLQIQSSQSHLNKTIQNLASIQSFQIKHSENILYVSSETIKKLFPSLLDTKNLSTGSGKPKAIDQDKFKLSSLDVVHAALVNKFWLFGGNERSQRFIERCIKNFPSSCVLGPEGTPASWTLMDQTGEMRMGGTMPEYRLQGLVSFVVHSQDQIMTKRGYPVYSHTEKSNIAMQKMSYTLQHLPMPCAWNQWKCMPM
nr:Glyat protein [Mus musculus]